MAALQETSFSALKGWETDDHLAAFHAFLRSARRMIDVPYKTRALGIDAGALAACSRAALADPAENRQDARHFFEAHFTPHNVRADAPGFVTGFYEPEVPASRKPSADFAEPLLRRPPQLVEIDASNRPDNFDPDMRFGWQTETGITESPDRGAIYGGALADAGLEIAYLKDRIEAFFIHVQGAAKLNFGDGTSTRVTFDGKSGHAYTSLGKVLRERLGVPLSEMTMDVLRGWMEQNRDELDAFLSLNRSYIFFRETDATTDGPIAAAKVPLVAGRSLAVDRTLHTFGVPIFVSTDTPLPNETAPMHRLMVAHDTGSAIVGAARGDIFCGTGQAAGDVAGRIQHTAEMVVLVPKGAAS